MRRKFFLFWILAIPFFRPSDLQAAWSSGGGPLGMDQKIRVVATTTTLASIVQEIAGTSAEVYAIASPKRDLHFYAPTPKDVLRVKRARVFVHGGLDLEVWRDPLLIASGNRFFLIEKTGLIDVSEDIPILEVPVSISRSKGDIHIYGNPHFWLDPANILIVADNIARGLSRIDSSKEAVFTRNAQVFARKLDKKIKEWELLMIPFRGTPVVTYHSSWPYFAKRFGLEIMSQIEPQPGIPPTARHIHRLITIMKENGVRLILKEPFFENQTPSKLAKQTGAWVLELADQVGAVPEAKDVISMFDYDIGLLVKALGERSRHG